MIEYILYERYYKTSGFNQQLNNLRIYNYNINIISKKSNNLKNEKCGWIDDWVDLISVLAR